MEKTVLFIVVGIDVTVSIIKCTLFPWKRQLFYCCWSRCKCQQYKGYIVSMETIIFFIFVGVDVTVSNIKDTLFPWKR